ncbi:ABC transporter permease [Sinomicrobium soli]|uniref:ABC transporter permease n=1 Tax=Sinomicrobium sp. N-1-3-6 TaxID=2219864 RepID=UPI000DCC10C1|nr:ABC transporter permease [Sinomicrobium sp. N-1-3-6]RAV30635.1 ABC transporter permease [Sinomicrobium sp. N-1-3-6]
MIRNYFKIAFRNLWRHRSFAMLNIGGLAIGMTAGFLIFLYVSFELEYDDFHTKGNRIYRVITDVKTPTETMTVSNTSWAFAPHLEREFPEIESAVRINYLSMLVQHGEKKYNEDQSFAADSAFFKIFDFKLLKGNKNTCLQAPFSLVLSETAAQKYFGDQDPMGKTLKILEEGYPVRITGIMEDIPENSHIKGNMVLSMTTFTQSIDKDDDPDNEWGNFVPSAYVLLRKGTIASALEKKFSGFIDKKVGQSLSIDQMSYSLFLEPLDKIHLWSDRGSNDKGNINNIYVFSVIAVFILLIACINFVNLTTARSVERAREVGIRKVIGAKRSQLVMQFVGESLIISILAFFITLVSTRLSLPYFNQLAGKNMDTHFTFSVSHIFTLLCVALFIGILSGIYPAFILSAYRASRVLKGKFSGSSRGILLRKGLVISQFVIAIGLIIGTIVVHHQMHFMQSRDIGFNKNQVLVMNTGVNHAQKAFKQNLESIPGIASVSLTSAFPGWSNNIAYSQIENNNGDFQKANIGIYFVDFKFIRQFELKIIAGRPFSEKFATDTTQAIILNEKAVKSLGYNKPENVIGKRFEQWGREGEVIGVIKDFNFTSLQNEISPLSLRIEPSRTNFMAALINSEDIPATIKKIEDKWDVFLPQKPFTYFFLDEYFDRQYRSEIRFGRLFLSFSILAIFISCLGLLGLVSYSTLQRKREIGIRKVVGASVTGIVNLLSLQFVKLVAIAFLIASPLIGLVMHYWLNNFAYRISMEWWVFAAGGIIALFIALVTVSFQAVKAAMANPVKSLKTE